MEKVILKNVLIVDDEESLRSLIGSAISREAALIGIKIKVIEAVDGVEASNYISKHSFDCIVTDLKMPNLTGDEFTKFVQNSNRNHNTPLIVLSGFINDEFKSFSEVYEHIKFLRKPCSPSEVAKSVLNEIKFGKKDSRISLLAMNPFLKAIQDKFESSNIKIHEILKAEVKNEIEQNEILIHCCLNISNGNSKILFLISLDPHFISENEVNIVIPKNRVLVTNFINSIFELAVVHLDICLGGASRLVGVNILSSSEKDKRDLIDLYTGTRVVVTIVSSIGVINLNAISNSGVI